MDAFTVSLSKTVSHALRHAPEQYGLRPDSDGWVDVAVLLDALRTRRRQWKLLREDDLIRMNAASDKRRFELRGGKIRALYGHSPAVSVDLLPTRPPNILFHGTTDRALTAILREGLRPMKRRYVHLSVDRATAHQVGRRKAGKVVMLLIDAGVAHRDGVRFFRGTEQVWLAEAVSPEFIQVVSEDISLPRTLPFC